MLVWEELPFSEIDPLLIREARRERSFITEIGHYWRLSEPSGGTLAVIGFVWHSRRHVRVRGHYVPPGRRGEGFGSRSFDYLLGEARKAGATQVTAAVKPWLVPMYNRRGFVQTQVYADGEVEVQLGF